MSEPRPFRAALAIAGVLILGLSAAADPAQAKPKRSQSTCNCSCDTGANGSHDMSYAGMASCGGYNGKTCNVEVSPGIIRSGTLKNCGAGSRMIDASASAASMTLSADPAKPQKPVKAKAAATTATMSADKK